MSGKRELWVDNVKVVACFLVLLGHLVQSMASANIIPSEGFYPWFNTTVYYFHVPLFFICSGFLYQKYSKVESATGWGRNVLKKLIGLGIPYVTFEVTVWVIKTFISHEGNNEFGGLFDLIFIHPTAPYWYLYCLFFVFLITPTFRTKKMAIVGLCISVAMKSLALSGMWGGYYALNVLFINEIWFVLGMLIAVFGFRKVGIWKFACLGAGFMVLSFFTSKVERSTVSFFMGLIACISIVGIFMCLRRQSKILTWFSKYTMPIFLMHSIFAATLRSVLLKLGIMSPWIQIPAGIAVSVLCPVAVAVIMRKTKYLEFFLYPGKFLKV